MTTAREITFIVEPPRPSRKAGSHERAQWGVKIMKMLLAGQKTSRKNMELAMHYLEVFVEEK